MPPGFERILNERYCLFLGPWAAFTSVQRLRLAAAAVEATVAEVRGLIRERGHTSPVWWVGESATPGDLTERLLGLGFARGAPPHREARVTAMALLEPPPAGPADVEARIAETLDDFRAALEISLDVFGIPEHERDQQRAEAAGMFERRDHPAGAQPFLAFVDGRPAATATAVFAPDGALLIGGSTLPELRGRGAYRALVRARWDEAVRRGTPAAVVQGGAMSRPILERLGFEAVCDVDVLVDEALGG